jgi:hypothetical protein
MWGVFAGRDERERRSQGLSIFSTAAGSRRVAVFVWRGEVSVKRFRSSKDFIFLWASPCLPQAGLMHMDHFIKYYFGIGCQSALKIDPPSASKIDPPQRLVFV